MTAQQNVAPIPAVRLDVRVKAPVERAFTVFTDGFGTWWPKTHTIASAPVERAIIEPSAGGRCYDRCDDGTECDWGTVLEWDPPRRLVLAWQVTHDWGYEPDADHASRVTVTFTADSDSDGAGTLVQLVHDEFERHGDEKGRGVRAGVEGGWAGPLETFVRTAASADAD
ncbi:MAG: hypothetical protein QOG52_836 [Frankiaceae bacterium]|jgi:uncharacterized protein YndB with AHSA1/START domain|nr:hypothetical protein [Frankiaceae bacterium]